MRQPFLQCGLGLALQRRVNGGVHRVGLGRQIGDAIGFRFTPEIVDKMKAAVAMRPLECGKFWRVRQRLVFLFGGDDAVLLHPAKHVGQPLIGPIRMTVRIEIARSLEQTRKQRALAQR